MSQKQFQKEFIQILDDWGAESGALAKVYLKDGLDSHPAEFKVIRDKYHKRIQELCLKYVDKPEEMKSE